MHTPDLKMYLLNAVALVVSLSDRVESTLKIILLLVSIVYTCIRILDYFKKKNKRITNN